MENERITDVKEKNNDFEQMHMSKIMRPYNGSHDNLKILAWIEIIGGTILGFLMGSSGSTYLEAKFSFSIALSWWIITIVMVIFTFAFADTIQILHDIRKKIYEKNH